MRRLKVYCRDSVERMQLIALTGGMASGKSTIGRHLETLGAKRIDADQLARDAIAPGSRGLALVRQRFGEAVFDRENLLDRAALGRIVFTDPTALKELNAIVHPEVRRLGQEAIQSIVEADPDAIIVYEIPLFVESGAGKKAYGFDWTMVVTAEAPEAERIRRAVELRGMKKEEAVDRISKQASDADRRAAADVVIDTSGSEEETLRQTEALWKSLTV